MKTDDKRSGVYAITCLANGKVYVGSAVCLKDRLKVHLSALRLNKHHSPYMQSAWNKHGEDCFSFDVLMHVEKSMLIAAEQKEMNSRKSFDRQYGFNVCPVAGSPLGRKSSPEVVEKIRVRMLGNTHLLGHFPNEETLEKLRAARVGKTPAKGMKHTEETKAIISKLFKGKSLSGAHACKISAALTGKEKSSAHRKRLSEVQAMMTSEDVQAIREKKASGVSRKLLSIEYGCSETTIFNVVAGRKQAYQCL